MIDSYIYWLKASIGRRNNRERSQKGTWRERTALQDNADAWEKAAIAKIRKRYDFGLLVLSFYLLITQCFEYLASNLKPMEILKF